MQAPRPDKSKQLKTLVLLLCVSVGCLIGFEYVLRYLGPGSLHPESRLQVPYFKFWSSPHFRSDESGAVCFLPDESVRSVSIFNHEIEYDVSYRTNDFGLIDHEDYGAQGNRPSSTRRIAVAGDSFVAGTHGGDPWVPSLRDRLRAQGADTLLYNLGVSGASMMHVEKLLASVHDRIGFDEIAIVGISDDFRRNSWRPYSDNERIWFAVGKMPREVAVRQRPAGHVIRGDETAAELSALSRSIHAAQVRGVREGGLLRSTCLGRLLTLAIHRLRGYRKSEAHAQRDNLEALERIRARYPDMPISFIHLPEPVEVQAGRYERELGAQINRLGIRYWPALTDRDWSLDMFHRTHPNAAGYRRIADYVQEVLELEGPRDR